MSGKRAHLGRTADKSGSNVPPVTTLLASGRAADIYALDDERVLKRDREGRSAEYEAAAMRHAREHGFPVPEVFSASGTELVMERVAGPTMTADLARRPWRVMRNARLLADLHERLHRIPPPPELPSRLGGDAAMVHGDLHPDNVLLGPHGPVVIDWANAGRGRPADDVAMAWLIIAASDMPGGAGARALARVGRQFFLDVFLKAAGRGAAAARLSAVGQSRLDDPHVLAHEADAVRRVIAGAT
jgi:aminoglycoside phosphotransferase (APT) family kinase protein